MPRTPYTTRSGTHIGFNIRVPEDLVGWLDEIAKANGVTRSEVMAQLLEDTRTFFEMPQELTSSLEKDSKSLGLAPRDYLAYLLHKRFRAVRAQGVGFDRTEVDAALRLTSQDS